MSQNIRDTHNIKNMCITMKGFKQIQQYQLDFRELYRFLFVKITKKTDRKWRPAANGQFASYKILFIKYYQIQFRHYTNISVQKVTLNSNVHCQYSTLKLSHSLDNCVRVPYCTQMVDQYTLSIYVCISLISSLNLIQEHKLSIDYLYSADFLGHGVVASFLHNS